MKISTTIPFQRRRCATKSHRRSGTLYIAVMGAAMIVSIMGFSALTLARLQLRDANETNEWSAVRLLAASAIENCITRLNANANWRTTFTDNVEYPATPVVLGNGSFTWKLVDADGDLADDNTDSVTIYGIGRLGVATSVEAVIAQPSSDPFNSGMVLLEGSWTRAATP